MHPTEGICRRLFLLVSLFHCRLARTEIFVNYIFSSFIVIIVYVDSQEQECDDCMRILEELENIDDDTDRHGIHFVKTQDLNIATNFGVTEFPAVIYFENQVPSIYEGSTGLLLLFIFLNNNNYAFNLNR